MLLIAITFVVGICQTRGQKRPYEETRIAKATMDRQAVGLERFFAD